MKIGYATFKESFTQEKIDLLLTEQIQDIIEECSWNFNCDEPQNWSALLAEMQQADCKCLQLMSRQNAILLKCIIPIPFKSLTDLNICYTKVTNIEPLAFLDAPNIQHITFSSNSIVSIKPLNKLHSNRLRTLTIKQKYISEISLSRFRLKQPGSYINYEDMNGIHLQQVLSSWPKWNLQLNLGSSNQNNMIMWFQARRLKPNSSIQEKIVSTILRKIGKGN